MAGFVCGFGTVEPGVIDAGMERIEHRGRYRSGTFEGRAARMGQRYHRADLHPNWHNGARPVLPVADASGLRICYDGQLAGVDDLFESYAIPPGAFRDERLLLAMYRDRGPVMLDALHDSIFSLVIFDGSRVFTARDALGIKPLYVAEARGARYLASELKALAPRLEDVAEFPAGCSAVDDTEPRRYFALPDHAPDLLRDETAELVRRVRRQVSRSLLQRVPSSTGVGCLLSGGVDSSVVSAAFGTLCRERGDHEPVRTYAIGIGGAGDDIRYARQMAAHLGSRHVELTVQVDEVVEALAEVIYYLESFDPSLVRSAVSNFLISRRAAADGIEILLSGEGGDELFCGYEHMRSAAPQELHGLRLHVLGLLHNNACLRLDRMNQCGGIRVVAPLASGALLETAMRLPPKLLIREQDGKAMEKWILRKAFEDLLPPEICWRTKREFSQGSGSADLLPAAIEQRVSEDELRAAQDRYPFLRSREELHYFRIFANHFGTGNAVQTVGRWVSP